MHGWIPRTHTQCRWVHGDRLERGRLPPPPQEPILARTRTHAKMAVQHIEHTPKPGARCLSVTALPVPSRHSLGALSPPPAPCPLPSLADADADACGAPTLGWSMVEASPSAQMLPSLPLTRRASSVSTDLRGAGRRRQARASIHACMAASCTVQHRVCGARLPRMRSSRGVRQLPRCRSRVRHDPRHTPHQPDRHAAASLPLAASRAGPYSATGMLTATALALCTHACARGLGRT